MRRYQHGMFSKSLVKLIKASVLFCMPLTSYALTFDSGSNGSDGVLDYTWAVPASGYATIIFDPSDASTFDPGNPDRKLDVDNDNVFHFESILIPSKVRVRLTSSKLNWAPVYWLSQGDITLEVAGFLYLSGDNGHDADSKGNERFPALPGPGGFPGGIGASSVNSAQSGFGPGAGAPSTFTNRQGGAASHATIGDGYYSEDGAVGSLYGSPYLLPLIGGSGGSGGGNGGDVQPDTIGGGGAGGGAILLASNTTITVDGGIDASGGNGRGNSYLQGGAGSGGAIRLLAHTVQGQPYRYDYGSSVYTGWLTVSGGAMSGGSGGAGRVRIEAFNSNYQGNYYPDNANSIRVSGLVPTTPFLPSDSRVPGWPRVSVTSINGNPVNAEPTGSFEFPDATVEVTTELPVVFESKNVPITATLNIHIYGPDFEPFSVSPVHVSGDVASSTWGADVAFPVGVSRAYVQATWVP